MANPITPGIDEAVAQREFDKLYEEEFERNRKAMDRSIPRNPPTPDLGAIGIYPPPNQPLTIEIPSEVLQYREDIRRFVDAMVYKLKVHHRKGRWEDAPVEAMIEKLKGEVTELEAAVKQGNLVEVMLEAADVANYGLIIAAIAMERGK